MTGAEPNDAEFTAARLARLSPAKRALLRKQLLAREAAAAAPPMLSFAQERLWLLGELTPGLSAYNTTRVVRVDGAVDEQRLVRALRAVVKRHAVLRNRIVADAAGKPLAHVAEPGEPVLEAHRVEDEAAAFELVRAASSRPFDLATEDLIRAVLIRVADSADVLALVLHHIASDEGSRKTLWDDLDAAYAGADLAPLPMQYADFARAQRAEFEQPAMAEQIEWWREQLRGAPQTIELPADFQRPAVQTFRGARHPIHLPDDLTAQLRSFAAQRGATLFMSVFAGFSWLLRTWAGTDDVVVGMPVSGRDDPKSENLIGLFVNTVVVRTECSGEPAFAELVDRARTSLLASLARQSVPFEKVVEACAPARDLSRNPIFQVLVNAITGEQDAEFALGELRARSVDFDPGTTKFDLGVLVADRGARGVDLVFEYATDLFRPETIADLAEQVLVLLRNALADPQRPLSRVSALPDEQRHRLVEQVNDTEAPFPDVCLHELISQQAERTPDAIAVADSATALTYREFEQQSNSLAHHLRSLGVGPNVPVAVSVRRSVAMELAVVAVLKAGGGYVPLDADYPADRLAYMLADCAAPVLLTERAVAPGLPPHPCPVFLDDVAELIAGQPVTPPDSGVGPGDLAYTIYTSGSTGKPKGVQLEHRGVVNRLTWMQRTLQLDERDTVLQKTPLSFDVSVWEVLWPLMTGARLFLARPNGHRDAGYLVDVMRRESVTLLHFVPSMLATFLDCPDLDGGLPALRAVVCSGEALPYDVKEQFFATLPGAELHNLYGPTEASIDVTWFRCAPGPSRVLIGAPIDNVQVYVVDEAGEPVGVGVPGELYLAGVQLARGYAGRPDLTAERFVEFPLAPARRAYRTGDVVRWTSAGEIDYLGRADNQVKLRGFRIELGEIENAIQSSSLVRQSSVVLAKAPSGDPVLSAYVVLADEPGSAADGTAPETPGEPAAAEWNSVWEQTYQRPAGVDPYFDISGWSSSFTGQPIPADEMAEWVDATVERIGAFGGSALLEIGSGSGLLLWRFAPGAARYVATDFAAAVTDRLRRLADERGLSSLTVVRLVADEVTADTVGRGFDTVIVNSVAQYFPDGDYLRRVLATALGLLAPGGRLFVGDVRDLRRFTGFAIRAELGAAPARSAGELALRVAEREALDGELLVHPALFAQLPGAGFVRVLPKLTTARNEMTCFRYDVVVSAADGAPEPIELPEWAPWAGADELTARLATGTPFGRTGLPDARTVADRAAEAALAAGRLPDPAVSGGVDPHEIARLAAAAGMRVEFSVARAGYELDAAFTVDDAPVRFPAGPAPEVLTNDPPAARRLAAARADAVTDLFGVLRARLPEYMVPASITVLPWLPTTPNGKLDRDALPAAIERRAAGEALVAPRTETERQLATLWADLLGIGDVGVHDNFFRFGGHSLLAVRLVTAVNRSFGVTVPLRTIFETPTIAALAAEIDRARDTELGGGPTPLDRAEHRVSGERADAEELAAAARGEAAPANGTDAAAFPLSWAQERIWFLEELERGLPIYTVRRSYRLRGTADPELLQRVLVTLADRHEVLRTTVRDLGNGPIAVIPDAARWPLTVTDLRTRAEPAARARELIADAAAQPFDLANGPLATAALYRLRDDDAVFVLRLHHVVIDGWSLDVVIDELARLYAAGGDRSVLPDRPLPYPDFAVWQRRVLDERALAAQLDYWRDNMAGAPPVIDLPTDHRRRPTSAPPGRRVNADLGGALTDALRTVARDAGTTPFTVLYAACSALLGRLAGQDDIVLGTAVAGRQRPEVERSVGLFANTLLLRTDLSGAPTFAELLDRCRRTVSAAQANQDVPFERLVEELRPERELGRNPLFQVLINLQPPRSEGSLFGDVSISSFDLDALYARFDLTFSFVDDPAGLRLVLEYRADLFDDATVEALLTRFLAVLRAACAAPATPVAALPVVLDAERVQLLEVGCNFTEPPAQSTLDLIRAQVDARPDAVAVAAADGPETLSYAELWRRSGILAARIAERAAPRSLVGLAVGRRPGALVAVLAAWRAGCAYVPVDLSYPRERVEYMLTDSGVEVVLRDDDVAEARFAADIVAGPLPPEPALGDLAYVIYTSGSTGRPKGVAIEHGNLVNLLTSMRDCPGIAAGEHLLALTTFSFDISILELCVPLISGATTVLAGRDISTDPHRLAAVLRDRSPNVVQATPSTFRMLIDSGWTGDERLRVWIGGEQLPAELAGALLARAGELWNCYGPTETTIWSTVAPIDDPTRITIGAPVANTAAYVLDEQRNLVPPGTKGELWLGGVGVARGYLDRPELTADRFVADPFRPGDRMYRTGDVAAWGRDGALRCFGRADGQIKLRGHRIELSEIEVALESAPGVREAVVILREDRPGDPRIVGYVVGTVDGVLDRLREQLPAIMVPSTLVTLESVPRTPNGKTDRAALPAPDYAGSTGTPPGTPTEQLVAGIWAELLGVEQPYLEDDFFALGGHSLLATRLAARLGAALGRRVELHTVFEYARLGPLAAALDRTAAAESGAAAPTRVAPDGRRLAPDELADRSLVQSALDGRSESSGSLLVYRMSSMQARMWLLHQMAPHDPGYTVPVLRRLRGPVDSARLRSALATVVERFDVLRTTYRQVDDLLVQVVHPAAEVEFTEHQRAAADAVAAVRELAAIPFDLAAGPALRLHLARQHDDEALLLLCAHHIALDGWSIDQLLGAVADAYAGAEVARPQLQFADYAVWEAERPPADDDRAFWRQQLDGVPPESSFPPSYPRPIEPRADGRRLRRALDPAIAAGLTAFAREHRATPFAVLCAAVSTLLSRHGAGRDVAVGTPFAMRSFAGGESLLGVLLNTVVLRVDVDEDVPFATHVERVSAVCADAFRHGDYPFDRVVAEAAVDRDPARHPLFQVLLSVQDARPTTTPFGAARLEPVEIDWQTVRYDTAFTLSVGDAAMELVFQYRLDLFDEQTAAWLMDRLITLLSAGLADPAVPLRALPALAPDEHAVLAAAGGHVAADGSQPTALPAQIRAVATATPDRPAVAVGTQTRSYGELVARADAVAAALQQRGVGPGDLVALCLGHDPDWPAAVLGIWTAGAAFVPIDPGYPAARRDFMLADSGCRLALTTGAAAELSVPSLDVTALAAARPEPVPTEPDAPAYVIYTSGSTGTPKGVVITHGALGGLAAALRERLHGGDVPAGLRVSANAPVSFDASIQQLQYLGAGATLCPIPEDVRLDAAAFVEYLGRLDIDLLDATPTHLRLLLDAGLLTAPNRPSRLLIGGEPIDSELWARLRDCGIEVWNLYGPTEVTVDALAARITGTVPVIGTPLSGVELRIVDELERVVPVGAPGELWLAGRQVAVGYLRRPELTVDRFVSRDGRRWYRTGDIVRLRSDGTVEHLGRADDQVKIRGHRIEPGEVAAALRALPNVAQAAVVARDGELVGYVVPSDPDAWAPAELRHALRQSLPSQLVPAALVPVGALALLPNGKLDLAAMKALAVGDASERAVVLPSGPAEELVAELWSELLGVARISADDDFFDLGGDSLIASRFVARLRAMDIEIPLLTVFTHSTVRALAGPVMQALLADLDEA